MKIEGLRSSFTVYLIVSHVERAKSVLTALSSSGYLVASFTELTAAFSEIHSNPPHFLIFDVNEKAFQVDQAVHQMVAQLPESHIFLLCDADQRQVSAKYFDQGIYDLILWPLGSPLELSRALDRAAERDYLMYLNERLMQDQAGPPPVDPPEPSIQQANTNLDYAMELFQAASVEQAVEVHLGQVTRVVKAPSIYFRFVSNRRVLLAGPSLNVEGVETKDLGLNLNEVIEGFRAQQLREPLKISPFVAMIREVFGVSEFCAWPVESSGEIVGLVCALGHVEPENEELEHGRWLLKKALTGMEAERRLHVVTVKDLTTDLYNRPTFLQKITEEISRARRTRKPVCLVIFALDQYGRLMSEYGPDEANLILRAVARIVEKHSRINDVIGRTGADEFAILLPHTGQKGALVKAERIRRVLESADFSRVLNTFPRLSVSLGVAEYPAMSRDADDLLALADEALFQIRRTGNRTCLAKPPAGFEPDFVAEGS